MKKVIIIAMLLTIICVCGASAGVCFADEDTPTPSEWYYFEKSDDRPNLPLRAVAEEEGKVLLYIPHSYAFEKVEEPNGAFVKVKYNSKEGYISTAYFNSNCKRVTEKWGNNPYAYDLSNLTVTVDKITPYKIDDMTADSHSFDKSEVTIKAVYGYRVKDGEYYFLVDATATIYSTNVPIYGYFKAGDTNMANFKEEDMPVNAGYKLQTTPEKPPTPSGEITSGNNNNPPSADKNGSDTQTPKNSLDRYILIAVIAVLCVVIVILIFVPTRKRQ